MAPSSSSTKTSDAKPNVGYLPQKIYTNPKSIQIACCITGVGANATLHWKATLLYLSNCVWLSSVLLKSLASRVLQYHLPTLQVTTTAAAAAAPVSGSASRASVQCSAVSRSTSSAAAWAESYAGCYAPIIPSARPLWPTRIPAGSSCLCTAKVRRCSRP